jgi:hypothetical protein
MFDRKYTQINWAIWLQWVLLTSISKLLVITGLNILLPPNWDTSFSELVFYVVWGLLSFAVGAIIATTQWWMLRPYFSGAMRWIVVSGAGMVIGTFVAFPLKLRDWYVGPSGFQLDEIAYGVVFGFLVGVAQWLVMRVWVRGAGWWILSSTLGWALGMTIGELLPLNWSSSSASLVYGVITEGIPVVVTGLALMILIQFGLKPTSPVEKSAGYR